MLQTLSYSSLRVRPSSGILIGFSNHCYSLSLSLIETPPIQHAVVLEENRMRLNELIRHCSAPFFTNDAVVAAHDIKKQQYDDKSNTDITLATMYPIVVTATHNQ